MYSGISRDNYSRNPNEAANTKEAVVDTLNKAGQKVSETLSSASEKISKATTTTTEHVRSNPIQSTFLALGIGYVLGKLFSR